jgi:hypothetical protein
MQREGPILESLTRRLAETPEDFLAEPRLGGNGTVHTAAVVADLLTLLGNDPRPESLTEFLDRFERNRLALTLILCWLLSDDWFQQTQPSAESIFDLLAKDVGELATQVASRKCVTDPDRREELVRVVLARLGYRPAGETLAQAQDRLTTLNSAERARVMRASRAAEERARQIREALAKKAAEESADKWTRE